jgi:O-antigen ligase
LTLSGLLFVAGFVVGLGMCLFRHPIYGLYTYVAVFYLHPPSRWWGEFLPELRWSLIAALVTLIGVWMLPADKARPSWISTTPARLLVLYTVWLWVQTPWALAVPEHIECATLFSKYVLLFYLIYRLTDTTEKIEQFMLVHIGGCFYLGWLAFNMTVSGRLEGVGGPGIDEANALGMQMGTAAMCAAMIILVDRRWVRWFCIAAMPLILNAMILSGSRGAFLSIICGCLMLTLLKPKGFRAAYYFFAILGIALFVRLGSQTFWDRVGTMEAAVDENVDMDQSAESRLVVAKAMWHMAEHYPLGTGHRGTAVLSTQYLDPKYLTYTMGASGQEEGGRSSHNTFMTALVEQGVPGAILYAMTWLWCFRALGRLKRQGHDRWPAQTMAQVASLGGALIVIFVAGQFVDYLKAEVQVWLMALLASLEFVTPRTRALEVDAARLPLERREQVTA